MKSWREKLCEQIEACAEEIRISAPPVFSSAEYVNRGQIIIKLDPDDGPTINYDFDVIPRATCNRNRYRRRLDQSSVRHCRRCADQDQ